MAEEEKIRSFVLVKRDGGDVLYVAYGCQRLTVNLQDARRYDRKFSADIALRKLAQNKKLYPESLRVEAIEE